MLNTVKKFGAAIAAHRVKIATTAICLVLCAANVFITVSGANTITIYYNGVAHEVSTYRTNVNDVIAQSDLDIDPDNSYIDASLFDEYGLSVFAVLL